MGTPQKVFITGASSGIGLALAAEYVRRGAIVGLVARRMDALKQFRDAHPQHPILIYAADVRDADELHDALYSREPPLTRDHVLPLCKPL